MNPRNYSSYGKSLIMCPSSPRVEPALERGNRGRGPSAVRPKTLDSRFRKNDDSLAVVVAQLLTPP